MEKKKKATKNEQPPPQSNTHRNANIYNSDSSEESLEEFIRLGLYKEALLKGFQDWNRQKEIAMSSSRDMLNYSP